MSAFILSKVYAIPPEIPILATSLTGFFLGEAISWRRARAAIH
jgi:hypothetical protein